MLLHPHPHRVVCSTCLYLEECVVWAQLHGDRYGLELSTRTRSEPASSRRGCGLAEEAAPRACCSAVLGVRAAKGDKLFT